MPGDTLADNAVIKPLGGADSVGTQRTCLIGWMLSRQGDLEGAERNFLASLASVELSADHPIPHLGNALIMESLGTADFDFYNGLLTQLANVGTQGKTPDERGTNFLLAMVRGIGPKDEIEAMMAAQMAAVHMTTMSFARRLAHVDNILQQDSAERAFNKLARTFAVQVEALKRYRTGGEQKVTVQHVTVNDGGQAIVGTVSPQVGGREDARKS